MGNLYRRAGTSWIKYYRGVRPHHERAHSDKVTEAKRFLALQEGQVVEGRFPGLRVERARIEELAKDYVRDYEINGWTSIKGAQRYVRVFTEVIGLSTPQPEPQPQFSINATNLARARVSPPPRARTRPSPWDLSVALADLFEPIRM